MRRNSARTAKASASRWNERKGGFGEAALPLHLRMQADYLIIGQGIAGTWLSYFLAEEKASFVVIDAAHPRAPSRVAAGIINPVTGRRYHTTWLADTLIPFAAEAYRQLGEKLGIRAISRRTIIDFFPTPQMRQGFMENAANAADYMRLAEDEQQHLASFNYELGFGTISPAYTAHLDQVLPAWRKELQRRGLLVEAVFDSSLLHVGDDHVQYDQIRAGRIIFCDGMQAATHPLFQRLPFAPNKGEALLLEIPGLNPEYIYKRGMMLVPLATENHWWLGSGYQWDYPNLEPTPEFRQKASALLRDWLRMPFSIQDHLAAERPATVERRPFVGVHPHQPLAALLNGLGTKGCSLAPFFARELVNHLLHGKPITPQADLQRFSRVLAG